MANQAYTNYNPSSSYNIANLIKSSFHRLLLNMNTILPCEILNINSDNSDNYDVLPLCNWLDSNNQPMQPTTIYNLPTSMIMAGNAGLILQYKARNGDIPGDTVLVAFCQRDITNIKKNWQQGTPPSFRKFALNDGIILFKLSNDLPTTFIKITDDNGIEINANSNPINISTSGDATISAQSVTIDSNNINLAGEGGAGVLTSETVITSPNGPCTISNQSTKVKALI